MMATIIFFCISWVYMGRGITSCSVNTVPSLGSDSTGGMAWSQWVGGNDFSWGYSKVSNYPFGEQLDKPQNITSSLFIGTYKLFASLTSSLCGLNLVVLLGYLSTALLMFGLVKWILRRWDVAIFSGYAAAFVPFHVFKAQSHINYIYGSIFIAIIWAFMWMISKPSYLRAALFGLVGALGYYFDGYFILISSLIIGGLAGSQFLVVLYRMVIERKKSSIRDQLKPLKYTIASLLLLALLISPILLVGQKSGKAISQSLASVRSNIESETLLYGARPIEFVVPAVNNPLMPSSYARWRTSKLHGSNPSESSLYIGYTVMILAIAGAVTLLKSRTKNLIVTITNRELAFILVVTALICLCFSLPAYAFISGHKIPTPTLLLVKLSANWRVLSRIFLAFHPLIILLAAIGLHQLTKKWRLTLRLMSVFACTALLFLEYLPNQIGSTSSINSEVPPIYKQLANDSNVDVVAEYPLADFTYTPTIFSFQPIHKKVLVNANDGSISKGPFASSIAGLNDPQTLGALRSLGVDEVLTHGFYLQYKGLIKIFDNPAYGLDKSYNALASSYAYKISSEVEKVPVILVVKDGFESLSVDSSQVSHRYITNQAKFEAMPLVDGLLSDYTMNISLASICPGVNAHVTLEQNGVGIWSGNVTESPLQISVRAAEGSVTIKTKNCSVDVTNMSAVR